MISAMAFTLLVWSLVGLVLIVFGYQVVTLAWEAGWLPR